MKKGLLHFIIISGLIVGNCFGAEAPAQIEQALIDAAQQGDVNRVDELLGVGADVDAQDFIGRTALMWAAGEGHEAVVNRLLDAGAKIDAQDEFYDTALIYASRNGREAVVNRLLERGANIHVSGDHGRTALHEAAEKGYEAIVRLLLEGGADPTIRNNQGQTAKDIAEKRGHENIVEVLDQAESPRVKAARVGTPLRVAGPTAGRITSPIFKRTARTKKRQQGIFTEQELPLQESPDLGVKLYAQLKRPDDEYDKDAALKLYIPFKAQGGSIESRDTQMRKRLDALRRENVRHLNELRRERLKERRRK